MRRHLNFWQTSELIPPILARLMARKTHGRPLTDVEIARAAGLTADRVFILQNMTSWNDISIVEAQKFLVGCGIDFCNRRQMDRTRAYLPRSGNKHITSWKYLRMSPEWRTKYEPLMRRYILSLQTK